MRVQAGDGALLNVAVDGPPPPTARATLVLLHGFCMSGASWARVRQGLRGRLPDLRVVSYDHRGHGRSMTGRRPHTIAQLADDLGSVLEAAAPVGPLVLAGHSLGAMVVLAHLAERGVSPRLRGVAVVGSSAGGLGEEGIAGLIPGALIAALPRLADGAPRTFEAAWAGLRRAAGPWIGSCSGRSRRPAARVLAELAASVHAFDVRDQLEVLGAVPTLILAGERDRITPPSHAAVIAERVRAAELRLLPGVGHNMPVDRPGVVAGLMAPMLERVCGRPQPSVEQGFLPQLIGSVGGRP